MKTEWWNGPSWLRDSEDQWPKECGVINELEVESEKRKSILTSTACTVGGNKGIEDHWYIRSNNYSRNVRILAYIFRWRRRCKVGGILSVDEIVNAERALWKIVQSEIDWTHVQVPLTVNEHGLKCVKLRITEREDDATFLMPVYLPNTHRLVEQYIRHLHLTNHHVGPRTLTVMLRERVWILNSKKIVHRVIGKCVVCRRFSARSYASNEPALPKDSQRCQSI